MTHQFTKPRVPVTNYDIELRINSNGDRAWGMYIDYDNGIWHKDGGPAFEYSDGSKYWYENNSYTGHQHGWYN